MNQLTKTSTNSEIKDYFNAVLKLAKASEEFPVNLDEVWPLVYSEKSKAVRALQENFIENVDYRVIAQNGKNPTGGRPVNDYLLSVSCLEFFIARKVRAVFEVYRQVFHKTAERAKVLKAPTIRERIAAADWLARFLNMNDSSKLQLAKTIAEPLGLPTPEYVDSKGVLLSISAITEGTGISPQKANSILASHGVLVRHTRKTSKGKEKPFWVISEQYLDWGENKVHPQSPDEVQTKWYEHKKNEILKIINKKPV